VSTHLKGNGPTKPASAHWRRRGKENRPGVRHCRATTIKDEKEHKKWAKALFFDSLERIETYKGERKSRGGCRIDTRPLMQPQRFQRGQNQILRVKCRVVLQSLAKVCQHGHTKAIWT